MRNKKKVLVICKGHQNIAGAQRYLLDVLEVFDRRQYELHFAFHDKDGSRAFHEISKKRPVVTWEYNWRHLGFGASFREARKLLHRIRPETVFYNSCEDEIIPAVVVGFLARVPCQIMVVHWAQTPDCLPLIVKKPQIPFPIVSRYALLTRYKRGFAYAMLDRIIFVNNITRVAYNKLYRTKPSKCTTIYNGIEPEKYRVLDDMRQKARRQLAVRDDQFMLLATGNLTHVKGHQHLVDAVAMLMTEGKFVKCFIAGQGELESHIKEYVQKRRLENQISLLGYRDDIPQLLAAADIFCMPSLNEALGYSLIEAMAAGKPVVASRVGGIPEVITDNVDGILVSPGNSDQLMGALNLLLGDAQLRTELGRNAVCKIKHLFSQKQMLKDTSAFINCSSTNSERT